MPEGTQGPSISEVKATQDTTVMTPNSDTPYSMGWLHLRAEPAVISVPAVGKGRDYSAMPNDGNTFNCGYIGSRATGNDAGDYLVAGPRWKGEPPPGIKKVFQSATEFLLAIFRTQLFDAKDMDNVVKVQSGYTVQPLSALLGQPAPRAPPGPEDEGIRAKLTMIGVGPGKTFAFKDLSAEHEAAVLLGM